VTDETIARLVTSNEQFKLNSVEN
jgi:hypothetical protein